MSDTSTRQFAWNGFDLLIAAEADGLAQAAQDLQGLGAQVETVVVNLAEHIVKDKAARGQGRILFTASVASLMPAPFEAVYGASKAFIFSFSEALRSELKDTGVTAAALLPGPTETNFFHWADMDDTTVGASKKDDPADVARDEFEALIAGRDKIIAGSLKTKVQGVVAELIPPTTSAEMQRKMSEPDSGEK